MGIELAGPSWASADVLDRVSGTMDLFLVKRLLIMGAVIVVIGCSSSVTPTPDASETAGLPVPTPTPVVAVAPSGSSGGTLTVAATADIPHLDVHQEIQETLTALGPGLAYSRLLRLRSGQEYGQPNLLLECDLCQSWQLTDDLAYEFTLRPGIRWQNIAPVNGRSLTAQDIVFSLERIKTPGWPNAPLLSSIGNVVALDDLTLQVELALQDADALLSLADGHAKIVAPEVVAAYGDLKYAPVIGTGPWVWQQTGPDEGMEFLLNTEYFEDGLPFLDQLKIAVMRSQPLPGPAAVDKVAAFKAGLVDVLSLGPGEWDMLSTGDSEFQSVVSRRSGAGVMLALNSQTQVLSDAAVRQAVFQAIDPWGGLPRHGLVRSGFHQRGYTGAGTRLAAGPGGTAAELLCRSWESPPIADRLWPDSAG